MDGRDLQLLVGAVFLSALGDWLALTALALHLEETTDSGIAVAALFIALWSPLVVFAGPAGLVADRFDARRVIVLASRATSWAVRRTARRTSSSATLLHERVPARLHGRAFATYTGLQNGAEMVALVLGGVLVASIGARWTLLLAGAVPAAVGLIGLAVYRRMRAVEAPLPKTAYTCEALSAEAECARQRRGVSYSTPLPR